MIGIYGGTFDPIHFGHLRPALEVQQALQLSEVRFIPCGQPPHRQQPDAPALQRLAMLRAAIAGQAGFSVDDREIVRAGPSYMVDTLKSLRTEVADTPLCLIVGFDAFLGIQSWSRWQLLFELANLVVTHRPGWSKQDLMNNDVIADLITEREAAATKLARYEAGKICFVPVTQLDIASTTIRALIQQGKDIRYLLPDSVYEMLDKQNIYG